MFFVIVLLDYFLYLFECGIIETGTRSTCVSNQADRKINQKDSKTGVVRHLFGLLIEKLKTPNYNGFQKLLAQLRKTVLFR